MVSILYILYDIAQYTSTPDPLSVVILPPVQGQGICGSDETVSYTSPGSHAVSKSEYSSSSPSSGQGKCGVGEYTIGCIHLELVVAVCLCLCVSGNYACIRMSVCKRERAHLICCQYCFFSSGTHQG